MTFKEKLYFLLDVLADKRNITPAGTSILIHPTGDLNLKIASLDLETLLRKLEEEDKIISVVRVPTENEWGYTEYNDGYYGIVLQPSFDKYYLSLRDETDYQQFTGKKPTVSSSVPSVLAVSMLHQDIYQNCHILFENKQYSEAIEKSFKIVRDKLRSLTGFETGSEAFGKTTLHISGAAAANVDKDFNEGVKFLTMAIDRFRNEKSHTSFAQIVDPQVALEYLGMSSLAMRFLDRAEINPVQ